MLKGSLLGATLVAAALCLHAPVGATAFFPGGSGEVTGTVTDVGGGVFEYSYTVANTSSNNHVVPAVDGLANGRAAVIERFLIPFFDIDAVAIVGGSIQTPLGWSAAFSDTATTIWDYDPLTDPERDNYAVPADVFVAPPYVLDFSTLSAPVVAGQELGGFSFRSLFGDTNGPVVIGFTEGPGVVDPPHVLSPLHPAAREDIIPEPATVGLLALGGMGLLRRRRKH